MLYFASWNSFVELSPTNGGPHTRGFSLISAATVYVRYAESPAVVCSVSHITLIIAEVTANLLKSVSLQKHLISMPTNF